MELLITLAILGVRYQERSPRGTVGKCHEGGKCGLVQEQFSHVLRRLKGAGALQRDHVLI